VIEVYKRKASRPKFLQLILVFLTIVLFSTLFFTGIVSGTETYNDPLTPEERVWLEKHPVIRLAPDPYFPPVEYLDKNGQYSGIAADYVNLLEKKLDIKFEIVYLKNWDEIIIATQNRQVDLLGGAYFSKARLNYLRFSDPYFKPPIVIITRDKVTEKLTMERLNNMKVVVVNGYTLESSIKDHYPAIKLLTVPNPTEGLRIVSFGIADAMIIDLATASYYLEKENISNLHVAGETSYDGSLSFACRKDWPELQTIINKGLAMISPEEKKQLNQRWINFGDNYQFINKNIIYMIILIISVSLIVLIFIYLWNRSLKRQILLQKQTERALRESETRFRNLTADVPALILIYQDNKIVYANNTLYSLLGYHLDAYPDLNFWDIVHPDYSSDVIAIGLARQRGETVISRYETKLLSKDGREIHVDIYAKQIDYNGQPAVICYINDISLRKRALEDLRKSEELYRTIFNTASTAMIIAAQDTTVTLANQEFAELYGYPVEEIENKKKWTEFVSAKDLERMLKYHNNRRIQKDSAPSKYEFTFIDRWGTRKDILISVSLIPETQTSIVSLVDYTQRKQAQEQIQYRLQIEKAIADISSLFLASGDHQMEKVLAIFGEVLAINRSCIFELDTDQQLFYNTYLWYSEGISAKTDQLPNIEPGKNPWMMQKLHEHEIIVIHDVNTLVPEAAFEKESLQSQGVKSALIIPFFSTSKELLGFFGFADMEKNRSWQDEDILALNVIGEMIMLDRERRLAEDQLRLSESRYRAVVEDQTEVIARFDASGILTFVNDAFCRFFEKSREELIGKVFVHSIYKEDRYILRNLVKSPFTGNTEIALTLRVVKPSGELAWMECTGRAIFNDRTELIEFQVVGHDVTNRIQLETKLALQNKMEAIGQLAAGIAHEINTPLQYVGDNFNFIKDAFADMIAIIIDLRTDISEGTEFADSQSIFCQKYLQKYIDLDMDFLVNEVPLSLSQSMNGINQVRNLVLAMKDFSHPGLKNQMLSNLNQGIEATVIISKNSWKYHADVEMDLDPELPLVYCSIDQINQVILNLIINASDAIKESISKNLLKRGRIGIRSRVENDALVIWVTDNGNGIPQNIQKRIFDPFFTTKEPGKGTGQGLAIAHDIIVVKHKGSLDFTSQEGQGTTFIISLPLNSNPQ